MKQSFCYVVQKIDTALSAHTIAIQLYFKRLYLAHQMAIAILSTAYEFFSTISNSNKYQELWLILEFDPIKDKVINRQYLSNILFMTNNKIEAIAANSVFVDSRIIRLDKECGDCKYRKTI